MDLTKALAELHGERARLDEAILVLSRLAGGAKRRGRPPKWMDRAAAQPDARPRRRGMSQAARKAQSQRMKQYWAAKRKAKA